MNLQVHDNMTAKMHKLKQMFESTDYSDVLTAGINVGMGVFKQRVFNKGLDVDGNPLGGYTKGYGKKREKFGRQAGYKDLEFTGGLRRSIDLVTVGTNVVQVQLTNEELMKIAHYQEEQTKTIIFKFSQEEKQTTKTQTERLLQQKINSIVQG